MLPRIPTFMACIAVILLSMGTIASTRAAGDPLTGIVTPKDGANACYRRIYDNAHLKRNPMQQSTEALLSFKYQGDTGIHLERIMLKRRGAKPLLYLAGGCDWSAKANRDVDGKKVMDSYPKDAGYACIALTAPGSAEEGGFFLIDLSADGNTATLYLDSPIASMRGKDKKGYHGRIDLGPEDRVFRLQRTGAAACTALEKALPDLP
jgi:hypothetical protein